MLSAAQTTCVSQVKTLSFYQLIWYRQVLYNTLIFKHILVYYTKYMSLTHACVLLCLQLKTVWS